LEVNGAVDLIGTFSSSRFTWFATFGRRQHSFLIIYFVTLHEGYIQITFIVLVSKSNKIENLKLSNIQRKISQ
jgi:hypothetical protein